jgi:hypothetical protein
VTVSGSNFLTDDYTAKVSVAGVEADSVTLNADEVVAVWEKGVPPVTQGAVTFWFENSG